MLKFKVGDPVTIGDSNNVGEISYIKPEDVSDRYQIKMGGKFYWPAKNDIKLASKTLIQLCEAKPDYQDELTIKTKARDKIFIEIKLDDIKFTHIDGDTATNWPDEWFITSYDAKILITYGSFDPVEIKDETNQKGLLAIFAPEKKILDAMIPIWKNNKC